jgi:hypothetical protein
MLLAHDRLTRAARNDRKERETGGRGLTPQ